ncbi:MAG: DUF4416 family protein [Desulfatiglandaceae bacterium]
MSDPKAPDEVKLVSSLFSPRKRYIDQAAERLRQMYGPIEWKSPELFFDRTTYYAREMGWPLHRRFVSFERLVPPDGLVEIKHTTNRIEAEYVEHGKRRINIDPGYVSAERLVLATGKNYIHRIYLGKGIYADLTLIFRKGSYRPLDWTYRDYADPEMVQYFNEIRATYMEQLREGKKID